MSKYHLWYANLAFITILLLLWATSKEDTTSCVWRRPHALGWGEGKGPPSQDTFLALPLPCSVTTTHSFCCSFSTCKCRWWSFLKGSEKGLGLFYDVKNKIMKREALAVLTLKWYLLSGMALKQMVVCFSQMLSLEVSWLLHSYMEQSFTSWGREREGTLSIDPVFICIYLSCNIQTFFLCWTLIKPVLPQLKSRSLLSVMPL